MGRIKDILRKGRAIYIRNRVGTEAVPTCDCVIVVAPHPDDEVFGCAGLMSRSIAEGKQVKLIIMTGGGKSHSGCCNIDEKELIEKRRELTRKAAEVYGLKEENICFLNFSDGEIGQKNEGAILGESKGQKDEKTKSQREENANNNAKIDAQIGTENVSALREKLGEMALSASNVCVFVPHEKGEGWSDHIETNRIVTKIVEEIMPDAHVFEYCVWFWFYGCMNIDWKMARVLKLAEEEYGKKQEAVNVYMSALAPCGKPWSGNLPKMFMWAMKWKKELFFERKK